ncbi:5'-methylthioadenosine/S-adenosylhomocysteine nucleosidase [Virgibacillus sp. L01]|uniref:5'-methylthioadenosine/S-adenosylhomocysteine nucleosidase n=1 Tax=Virgibacillus sp. L01 TaxID=3457429 RepID=UPI003FD601EE
MTIGIIGAMDEEIALLMEKMTNKKEATIANCLFIQGELFGQDVVLLKSGIGKVNAAMATTIMHERYAPSKVINTGSAGGFSKDLEVGDIVISTQVVHHDVDVTAFDYAYGQVPDMPAMYAADTELIAETTQAIKDLDINFNEGIIATGDSFMEDPERVAFIHKKFPTMIAAEMEAAAVAQVCYQYDKPFVIIRALSDIAGKKSSISFEAFLNDAAENAANLIMKMIKAI